MVNKLAIRSTLIFRSDFFNHDLLFGKENIQILFSSIMIHRAFISVQCMVFFFHNKTSGEQVFLNELISSVVVFYNKKLCFCNFVNYLNFALYVYTFSCIINEKGVYSPFFVNVNGFAIWYLLTDLHIHLEMSCRLEGFWH